MRDGHRLHACESLAAQRERATRELARLPLQPLALDATPDAWPVGGSATA